MKKNLKRLLSLVLVATLSIPALPMEAKAATLLPPTGESGIPDGVVLNYKDVETNLDDKSFADEYCSEVNALKGTLPSSYSASSKIPSSIKVAQKGNFVTAVKDQGSEGTCWAQAAISCAESSYMKATGTNATSTPYNWSEYHLAFFSYNTPNDPLNLFGGDYIENVTGNDELMTGGNSLVTTVNFANWIGVSNSSMTASDVLNGRYRNNTTVAFNDVAHLENGYFLVMPDMYSSGYQADMNVIKQAIMDYGSVTLSYYAYHYYPYWNNNAYQYIDVQTGTNHAITVVGWNDNISASSFGITAPGNGAWLIKNSWGTSWGQGGYFWLSYYDQSIASLAFAFDFGSATNYDNNYQYDGAGDPTNYYDYWSNEAAMANAFVTDGPELLEAVGFYTLDINMDYEVLIYTDLDADDRPQDGTLVHTQSGHQNYMGFHTVDLTKSIPLANGERYAVVIRLIKEGYYVDIPCDDSGSFGGWLYMNSYAKAGESYSGSSVESMSDMNAYNDTYEDGENCRIKAFTNDTGELIPDGDGNLWYVEDGEINYNYFGLCAYEGDTWYVKNGKANPNINGLVQCGKSNEWYVFVGGKVNFSANGIVKNSAGYWYVKNGQLDFTFNGVATNSSGTWYVANGKLDFTKNGIYARAGQYYYFVNGKVDTTKNGIIKNAGQYWYFVKGKIDFSYKGLVKNAGSWWYVQNGKIDLKYNGVATNENGTWYIANGKLDTTKNGILARGGQYYYFVNGKVDTTKNGIIKNAGSYWYFVSGKIDFNYKGIVKNAGSLWYVQKGKIDFTYDGVGSNEDGTWYVENGKVDTTKTGIFSRGGVYYYFKAGKVQTDHTGIVKNAGQYWYIENGKINFNFVGIVENAGSLWYVKGGKIDFTYSGYVTYNGQKYSVIKGKATLV